eukprot:1295070-Prymnesium_polylepis.1
MMSCLQSLGSYVTVKGRGPGAGGNGNMRNSVIGSPGEWSLATGRKVVSCSRVAVAGGLWLPAAE